MPRDESAFAGYCITGIDTIHAHHEGEEKIFFPHLSKQLDIIVWKRFQGSTDAFYEYVKAVFNKQEKYDAEKTVSLLRGSRDPLAEHLHDEIPTIQLEHLKKFEKAELDLMMKEHDEYVKKKASLFLVIPWCLSHHTSLERPNMVKISNNFNGC